MRPVLFDELIEATRGRPVGPGNTRLAFERVEIDSRRIRPGDLFWALEGERLDGHHFINDAADRGAGGCIGEAGKLDGVTIPAIAVQDTLLALWDFAEHYRAQQDSLVVGVTGSVGKTTTRHMIHAMLSARFSGTESPHNYNNHIGVPLSLLNIEPEHEFAVLELAASGVNEIKELAEIARPEIGVVTAIAPTHLDEFGSIENICRAKGELLEALPPTGFAVLNGDNDLVRQLASRARCPVILTGERVHNDLVASHVEVANEQIGFRVHGAYFRVPAVGRQHLTSALIAVAVGREVGMHDDEIAAGLMTFCAVPGRSRAERIGPWIVIDDTYNASPASMQAACETLQHWRGANKTLLVTGDMLALGDRTEEFHWKLGAAAAECGIHRLVAMGSQAAIFAGSAKQKGMDAGCLGACRDADMVMTLLDCWLEPGDVVLVKGSRDMRMEQIILRLRQLAERRIEDSGLRIQEKRVCA